MSCSTKFATVSESTLSAVAVLFTRSSCNYIFIANFLLFELTREDFSFYASYGLKKQKLQLLVFFVTVNVIMKK